MKKKIAFGLAGIMALASLTGCGKGTSKYLVDVDYEKYVELCEYKGVEATKVTFDVSEEELQEEIESYMYDYASYDPVTDRGVEVGDYAMITYTTTIDGDVSEEYSGEDEDIMVGEGYTFPDLEDALVGMKTGESKTVDVELTEDYVDAEYVGKTASVDVTLTEITVENLPEYNLEFVEENTEYDSLEDFEESIRQELMELKEEDYKYVSIEEIMTYVVENSKFNGYPDELYEHCEAVYDSQNEFYATMYGMTVDEYTETFGIDEETRKADIESSVNYELIVGAIATAEGLDCSESEINEYIDENYEEYGYESKEEFLEEYSMEDIGYELVYGKVSDLLYDNATFSEISEEEYLAEEEAYYEEDVEEESEEDADLEETDMEEVELEEEESEE